MGYYHSVKLWESPNTKNFKICSAISSKNGDKAILATHKYNIIDVVKNPFCMLLIWLSVVFPTIWPYYCKLAYIRIIKPNIQVSYDRNPQKISKKFDIAKWKMCIWLQHFHSDSKVDCAIKPDDSDRASKFLISSENEPQQTS